MPCPLTVHTGGLPTREMSPVPQATSVMDTMALMSLTMHLSRGLLRGLQHRAESLLASDLHGRQKHVHCACGLPLSRAVGLVAVGPL